MKILLIDCIRYKPWSPKDEEKEFHPLVKKCSKEIFGEKSIYFDVKHALKSKSGIGSIPDAYVINLSTQELCVVENELASHPVYDHIVKQLTKFINGIKNQSTKNQIVEMLYRKINEDPVLRAKIEKEIDSPDVHHFLSKLLSKRPRIVVIVDKKTPEIEEACKVLNYPLDIIEFQIFRREDAQTVHAYLFEPLSYKSPSEDYTRLYAEAGLEKELNMILKAFKEFNPQWKSTWKDYLTLHVSSKILVYFNKNPARDHGVYVRDPKLYDDIFEIGRRLGLKVKKPAPKTKEGKVIYFNGIDGVKTVAFKIKELIKMLAAVKESSSPSNQ